MREACKMRVAEPEMIPDAAHVVGKILQGAVAVEATRLTVPCEAHADDAKGLAHTLGHLVP